MQFVGGAGEVDDVGIGRLFVAGWVGGVGLGLVGILRVVCEVLFGG